MEVSILEKARAVFSLKGIEPDEQDGHLSAFVGTGMIGSTLKVCTSGNFVAVTVQIPIMVPDYRRGAVAEAVCRCNFGLIQGHFELDMSDGELRFRATIPLYDAEPTERQLDTLIFRSWSICSEYVPALAEVALGMVEPATAVEKAESNWKEMQRNEIPSERDH